MTVLSYWYNELKRQKNYISTTLSFGVMSVLVVWRTEQVCGGCLGVWAWTCVFERVCMCVFMWHIPAACGDMKPPTPRLMTAVCWFPKLCSDPWSPCTNTEFDHKEVMRRLWHRLVFACVSNASARQDWFWALSQSKLQKCSFTTQNKLQNLLYYISSTSDGVNVPMWMRRMLSQGAFLQFSDNISSQVLIYPLRFWELTKYFVPFKHMGFPTKHQF